MLPHRAFIAEWISHNTGRKIPAKIYEELLSLGRAWHLVHPATLPRALALWEMKRFDSFSGEYSRIKNVTVEDFFNGVPDPYSADRDGKILNQADDGALSVHLRQGGSGIPQKIVLTRSHLELRAYLNNLSHPLTEKVAALKISDLAIVLGHRQHPELS